MIHKGTVFWYKIKGKKYGAVVLDEIGNGEYYLILISEECSNIKTANDVMELPAYTAAWFSILEMIPSIRTHVIAEGIPFKSFNGYAGGFFSDEVVKINNYGQSKTWKHEYRQLSFHSRKMKEQIEPNAYNRVLSI